MARLDRWPRVYRGRRQDSGETQVTVNGDLLPLCLDIRDHSPTGFNWGYYGSGPAQLSLAILIDYYTVANNKDPVAMAEDAYQDFKYYVISGLADDEWRLTTTEILGWLRFIDVKLAKRHRSAL